MDNIQDKLKGLTEEEKKYVMSILKDMDNGQSKSFNDLMYEDYVEIPVDIETFVTDDNYMGQAWKDAEGKLKLYPFWLNILKQLFPNNTDVSVNNFIESGARGLGKSEDAIVTGQYLMYRVLCLKNPLEFFHMKPTEKICFAFMNITKELSEEIGIDKFQKSIQKSPWFMSKGRMTTYKNEPYWIPPEPIDIIIGSQASHVIGQPIFWCLSGNTVIKTTEGDKRLDELVGKDIKVISMSDSGDLIESDACTVFPTKLSKDEYEIELEDGSILHCTPEHRFMLIDGTYKQAKDLSLDDELMDFKPYGIEKLSLESKKIKIKRITKITNDTSIQYYDVINADPYNNFLVKTNSGYVVSHNCFFDEISFIRNMDIDRQKQIAINMIDTAIGGMKTRFIHKGKNPTLLVLASSKRSEKSFLEEHMKKKLASEKENVLIVDEPVWNVKPKGTYSDKTFRVALGNKFLVSKVLEDTEDASIYRNQGYKILDVPIDFRADFLDDIDRALCDFAGISSTELSKYISGQAINDCINQNRTNPFAKDILEIGNAPDDRLQYYNFFEINKIPTEWRSKPLYIHLDMSISGDKTGIAGVFAIGKKHSKNPEDQSKDMYYGLGFSVSIKAPKGRQVSFEKNRKFIYWLKEQGFNIKGISTDTFQSYDTGQQLTALGYPYKQISVDKVDSDHVCKPYQYFRSTIYERRIDMYSCKLLIDELIDLERNINTGKVDHPNGGSKDMSDAVCGALFNASQNAEQFAYDYGELYDTIQDVNAYATTYEGQRQQIAIDFEEELKNISNFTYAKRTKNNNDSLYKDFGLGPSKPAVYDPFIIM